MEFFMDFLPRLWLIGLQPTYFFMESCSEKGFFLPFCTLPAYFLAWIAYLGAGAASTINNYEPELPQELQK